MKAFADGIFMHTLAALQIGSAPEGTKATVDKILARRDEIGDSGCDLLVMPEALLGGYPKGADFGTRVGYRTDEGRKEFRRYWEQAVDLDGPEVAAVCELAKVCETDIVLGAIERGGSTLYCTALFLSAKGELVGKHRKLMPTASERLIWGQGDGSTLTVVDRAVGKVGAAICWENYMPLLRTAMYAKGVEVWCAPTVDDREIWQCSMRHVAYEGRCFLVSACQYVEADGADLIGGGSLIVSPMGEVLAGPLRGREGLISAEFSREAIVEGRYDLDPVGHYSRPDVFKLTVDESERPPCHLAESS